jgi:glycosyltransferase involved in cell wall biosynthesis
MKFASNQSQNILMIGYTYYESDPRVIREAEAAVEAGFAVDFLALRRPGRPAVEIIRGVKVVRVNQGKYRGGGHARYAMEYAKFFFRSFLKATTLHLRQRYAIVHVNNMPDFLVFSALVPRMLGAAVILDIHDPMPDTFLSKFKSKKHGLLYRLLLWQERLSVAFSSKVITVHDLIKKETLFKHGIAQGSVEVVANFPDDKFFPLRESLLFDGTVRLVFHGTILERAGLRRVLTALSMVRHKDRIFLKIIGEGDFSQELKQLISSLDLCGIVTFDNCSYPSDKIAEQFIDCNVGIVPLEINPLTNCALPLKLLEYVSLGMPVVSISNDAINHYLSPTDCIFYQWNSAESLSKVLDQLIDDPELLTLYRQRSVTIRDRFTWKIEKKKYIGLLRELVGYADREGASQNVELTITDSVQGVANWVEKHNYRAYDPGDGSLSFLRHLTFNSHIFSRVLTAAVLRTPFDIRPLIGIRPHTSTKGMGYMGWGYLKEYARTRNTGDRRRAELCFDWLMNNRSADQKYYCWGNDFSFSTRAGTIPKHTPTIVWSSLIGLAFLEAYEVLGDLRYLDVAVSTSQWVMTLPREQTRKGLCLSYIPMRQVSIHNSNLLGAALLAKVSTHTGDGKSLEIAREAVEYSCARQNADGAWFYGEASNFHWIDSFHTGYNLDSIKRYIDSTNDLQFASNLEKGAAYFVGQFFTEDGRAKYYHDRMYPLDIQCSAQAIDTLTYHSENAPERIELASKVALRTIRNMQAEDGHFYYRDLGWRKIKTPMFHWGQATMFKALTHLLNQLQAHDATGRICQDEETSSGLAMVSQQVI